MSYEDKNGRSKPTRAAKGKGKAKLGFGDYWFVELELSTEDQERFLVWETEHTIGLDDLDYLLADGCKISFSVDPNGHGILCSASQQGSEHENAGGILTGRAGSATRAAAVLLYKDVVVCNSGSWAQARHERGQSRLDIG
jgi:hypothetical protein